jgi:hypothetical protein
VLGLWGCERKDAAVPVPLAHPLNAGERTRHDSS